MVAPKKLKTEEEKQAYYRDARYEGYYGDIWTKTGKCVFCDLREKYILFEENGVLLTISMFAYVDGQMMVVTRRHIETIAELNREEWETVRKLMHMARKMIRKVHGTVGVNYVQRYGGAVANNTVPHFHVVIVPFDDPTLAKWDYRKLSYTPLENTKLYKDKRKFIAKQSVRFDKKYNEGSVYPIDLRAIVENKDGDILLIKNPNGTYDLLGGVYGNTKTAFEARLQQKISSAIEGRVKTDNIKLIHSAVAAVSELHKEAHLRVVYPHIQQVIRNIYQFSVKSDALTDEEKYLWAKKTDDRIPMYVRELLE